MRLLQAVHVGSSTGPRKHAAPSSAGSGRRRALQAVSFFLLIALVYVLTADYDQQQNEDIVATAVPAWSLIHRGTVDVTPYADASQWFYSVNGHVVSNRWPGAMLFALPAYAVTAFLPATQGFPVLWPATVTAVLVTAMAATVLFVIMRSQHGPGVAWGTGIVIAAGTGLWTVAADSLWTHGPTVLAVAFALLFLMQGRQWAAGSCFAVVAVTRPHLLVTAAIIGYIMARENRDLRTLVRIGIPAFIGLLVYIAYMSAINGEFSVGSGQYAFHVPTGWGRLENIAGALVSPRVGVLVYTPVIMAALPGMGSAWRQSPPWERAALFAGLLYGLVQYQTNNFFGGYGFYGYRLPLEALVLASPFMVRSGVVVWRTSTVGRYLIGLTAVWSVWISAVGALFYVGRRGQLDPWVTFGPYEALSGRSSTVVGISIAVFLAGVTLATWFIRQRTNMESVRSNA